VVGGRQVQEILFQTTYREAANSCFVKSPTELVVL
jgi:hypothetical protein